MQSEALNVINDLKLDMTASPVDNVTIITRAQLEDLEAALSAAEPVAWGNFKSDGTLVGLAEERPDSWTGAKPLYAAPPAPSVAVKALQVIANYRHHSRLDSDENAEAMEQIARSALSAQVQNKRTDDDEETYQIGVRDGYSKAVQEIDQLTGGDGEYRYCTDHDPERHTPGPAEMIQRIVDRFETLNLIDEAEKREDFWDAPGSAQVQDVARDLPSEFEKWWEDAGHYLGGVVKMTYTQRKQLAWDAFYASANPASPAKQEG